MGRYGGQKRRATTSKLYALDKDRKAHRVELVIIKKK